MRRLQSSQSLAFAAGAPAARQRPRTVVARTVFPRVEPRWNQRSFIRASRSLARAGVRGCVLEDSNTCLVRKLRFEKSPEFAKQKGTCQKCPFAVLSRRHKVAAKR